MKRMVVIGTLFLITTVMLGCSSESERMANMAERMVRSQNQVNSSMASANEKFVDLNKELQQERTGFCLVSGSDPQILAGWYPAVSLARKLAIFFFCGL